jgi:hypothetical protein
MLRRIVLAAALGAAACSDQSCNTGVVDVSEICVPQSLAPGLSADIDVRELCGLGCSGVPSCTALFRNAQVLLDTEQDVCQESLTANCALQGCQQRVVRCKLPALNPGDYVVSASGGVNRVLHVEVGGSSSCRFALDGGF